MKGPDKRLAQLQRIAGVMADRAMLPVAKATEQMHAIEARIAEIALHRARLSMATGDPSIAGTMLAQAERLRIRQAAALSELAAARVRLEMARKAAAQAVGRDQALGALIDKQAKAAEQKARRGPSA